MTRIRYQIIDQQRRRDHKLTRKEIKRGWHFCLEFDGALERLIPCGCYRPGFKTRLKKIYKQMEKYERRHQDHLSDLADAASY
jgi:hypothetical protein